MKITQNYTNRTHKFSLISRFLSEVLQKLTIAIFTFFMICSIMYLKEGDILSAIKKKSGRVFYIDMGEVASPMSSYLIGGRKAWRSNTRQLKSLDPYRKDHSLQYSSPEQLQDKVNEYFDSCYGPGYYKGEPILDKDGNPVIVQREPFTVAGLARHLKLSRMALCKYETYGKTGLIPREYADIIVDAKLRIQEYAEKRLYDKEGSSGARFVLEAGFGWMTKVEEKELRQNKKRIKVTQDKLKFLKETAEANKLTDNNLIVNIMRAGEGNDD